ncbi:MAG: antitoxin [Saccharofermentans sp.]|nr:antitoxin [Saccharofermentans sp.]
MMTAKVFENGRSQAVRLPKECRFDSDEVMVNKIGEIVILMPKTSKWDSFMKAVDLFSDDFMESGREQQSDQVREEL